MEVTDGAWHRGVEVAHHANLGCVTDEFVHHVNDEIDPCVVGVRVCDRPDGLPRLVGRERREELLPGRPAGIDETETFVGSCGIERAHSLI